MIRLLDNCCGVAEYRGTYGYPERILLLYARERNSADKLSYSNRAHSVVVMSFTMGNETGFKEFVEENKLGTVIMTDRVVNINHGGWNGSKISEYTNMSEIVVALYVPDHDALTKYVQKVDENYELKE